MTERLHPCAADERVLWKRHLRQEWTTFVLSNAADVRGEDVLRILFYQDRKQVPPDGAAGKGAGRGHRDPPLPSGWVRMCWRFCRAVVSGSAMVQAVCSPAGYSAEQLTVLADCTQMAELVHLAGNSVVPADAPAELRLAARQTTLTDHDAGAAAELLYGMVRSAETSA